MSSGNPKRYSPHVGEIPDRPAASIRPTLLECLRLIPHGLIYGRSRFVVIVIGRADVFFVSVSGVSGVSGKMSQSAMLVAARIASSEQPGVAVSRGLAIATDPDTQRCAAVVMGRTATLPSRADRLAI